MRRGNQNFKRYANFVILTGFPILISAILSYLSYKADIITALSKGLDDLFSIIIGILIALFGVLPSISDSLIMKKIREFKAEKELLYFCKETMILSFLSLFFTITLQFANQNYDLINYNYVFSIWIFLVSLSMISSFVTIWTLLKISFLSSNPVEMTEVKELNKDELEKLENKYMVDK